MLSSRQKAFEDGPGWCGLHSPILVPEERGPKLFCVGGFASQSESAGVVLKVGGTVPTSVFPRGLPTSYRCDGTTGFDVASIMGQVGNILDNLGLFAKVLSIALVSNKKDHL